MSNESVSRRDVLALGAVLASGELAAQASPSAAAAAHQANNDHAAGKPSARASAAVTAPLLDRAFLRLQEGLVHYRSAGHRKQKGGALPLYLAHAGPGSSRSFEALLPRFGVDRFAFAPDMLGNGDSAPPASMNVDIGYYVDCAVRVMDVLEIPKVDFYGSHTGAQIGCQLAVSHPDRVRRLVLDGIPLFPAEFKTELLAHYAPQVAPDDYGGQFVWAWNFVREQSLYWPYFDRRAATRLGNDVMPAGPLHLAVTDVLKALGTYHVAYRAAFAQDLPPLLAKLRCPVLMMASERDPLSKYLDDASALVPQAQKLLLARTATVEDRLAAVQGFLAS